jgi:hypothetical protein
MGLNTHFFRTSRIGLNKIIEKVATQLEHLAVLELTSEQQRHLAVIINLTPNRRNEFLALQKAKVRVTVLPILGVKTRWNSTLELLERAYRLREFSQEWFKSPKYAEYRPLCTTKDEWIVVQRLFRY